MVVAQVLLSLFQSCGYSAQSFFSSLTNWTKCSAQLEHKIHIFELLVEFLFIHKCALSPKTFGILYWAIPERLLSKLLALLFCVDNTAAYIHTTLFETAAFPPPLTRIGAPLWQIRIGLNGFECTVFEAYMYATCTIEMKGLWPSIPVSYVHPSMDHFHIIEPFWFELSEWVTDKPNLTLSKVSLVYFSKLMTVQHMPDMLFILFDSIWNVIEKVPCPDDNVNVKRENAIDKVGQENNINASK